MEKNYALAKELVGADIRALREMLELNRREFAKLAGVSPRTVEFWESSGKPVTGPIVFLVHTLTENRLLAQRLEIPEQEFPLRLIYMYKTMPCTLMDVDEANRLVKIVNFTDRLQFRAFGVKEHPDYEDFLAFLKSRVFPETRDKLKLELKRLGLPFYDPLQIAEKTGGRMEEDLFHLEFYRK